MEKTSTAHDASNLCQQCGLCCTGLLFEYVTFRDEELQNVELGSYKVKEPGKRSLPHPCQFLDGTSCGIYIDRPARCRSYACVSRQQVLNGEKALDECSARVVEIQDLLEQLVPISQEVSGKDYRNIGFRKFCEKFIKSIEKKLNKDIMPTQSEQKAIGLCFEIVKMIDRHFRKTSRLNRLAQLVTGIDYLTEQTK